MKKYNSDVIRIANDERKRVISERKALNITQTEIARFSGCTPQNVSAFENGKNDSFFLYMSYVTLCYNGGLEK